MHRRHILAALIVAAFGSLALAETPLGKSQPITWGGETLRTQNSAGVVVQASILLDGGADAGGSFVSDPFEMGTLRQAYVDCQVATASSCSATVPLQIQGSDACDGGLGWFNVASGSVTVQALTGGTDGGFIDVATSAECLRLVAEGGDGGGGLDGGVLSCAFFPKGI